MTILGKVVFTAPGTAIPAVEMLLDADPPAQEGGFGSYQVVDRPRRSSYVEWKGRSPMQKTLVCLFEGFATGRNGASQVVEDAIARLEKMASPQYDRFGKITGSPPYVRIQGAVSHNDVPWTIESLDWGPALWNTDEYRIRQQVTIRLTQYTPPPSYPPKKPALGPLYTVKKGDTPRSIAIHRLKSWRRWTQIRDLNPKLKIRDANQKLRKGTRLRLPAS